MKLKRVRSSDFILIERAVLDDPRLSLAAKGLYAVVAAWEEGQSSPNDESLTVVLNELVAAGYATVADDGDFVVGSPYPEEDQEPVAARFIPAPREEAAIIGWAYAITYGAADQVKLGESQNVAQRLKGLQIGHPDELRVLWQGAGGAAMEAHLHNHFARRRIRGEWFDFAGVDALKLISRAAKSFRGAGR